MRFLSDKAAALNISTGLKNGGAVLSSVLPFTQFSVNEQCVEFSECDQFSPYINASKPVFHIEYPKEVKSDVVKLLCTDTGRADGAARFSTVLKNLNLDGYVEGCDGSTANTPVRAPAS
jgi:hypothetical protein